MHSDDFIVHPTLTSPGDKLVSPALGRLPPDDEGIAAAIEPLTVAIVAKRLQQGAHGGLGEGAID